MDLTPQVINEVEFSMARRGYDPDQVDEFLEKVAVAVGEMHERIGDLRNRVVAAERRAEEAAQRAAAGPERVVQTPAPAAGVSAAAEAELETLKRTLLLAQRTADAAVAEAEAEAKRILVSAEAEARAAHEATLRAVVEDITRLEATRDALDAHVHTQRVRLEATVADLQAILEAPDRLPAVDVAPEPVPELEPELAADDDVVTEVRAEVDDAPSERPSPFVVAEEDDDEAWARFGTGAPDDVVDEGPRTEPVLRLDRLERVEGDDDAYLAELRKAMLDDTGAPGGADVGMFDDADAGRVARTRFGRRR
jgi:DivIVA domain-containing protein